MRARPLRIAATLTAALLTTTVALGTPAAHADEITSGAKAQGIARQLAAGLQVVPKDAPVGVPFDPALAWLPAKTRATVNLDAAARRRRDRGAARAAEQVRTGAAPMVYPEKEASGVRGANDTIADAEAITGLGTGSGKNNLATVTGRLSLVSNIPSIPRGREDNGSIPKAINVGLNANRRTVKTTGVIGDGPHGSAGDRHGDFDFYRVDGLQANDYLTVDVRAQGNLDAVVASWDEFGGPLYFLDDPGSHDILLNQPVPGSGTVYVMVSGFGPGTSFPANPGDSGSGAGVGTEGAYTLSLSTESNGDKDVYALDLKAGDVVGAGVTGYARRLSFQDGSGKELMGSTFDTSGIFPKNSPLPAGGNASLDLVAPSDGRYYLAVSGGTGPYQMSAGTYRPGPETAAKGAVQTLFLDFNGATVDTTVFHDPAGGPKTLSPLSAFLAGWGLKPGDQNGLIDAITATVRENIATDLATKSGNRDFAVNITNSRDDPDTFGRPNVSRLVVGGTIAESGMQTIGVAESIDPGNYGREETAVVLLDLLSGPNGDPESLNTLLKPGSDRIAFIGRAVGNIVSHEAGHFSGSWHTEQFNAVANLMDQGGNLTQMVGVGRDGVGGTADDVDVDFTKDAFATTEPFSGTEDTLARTAWAYSRGRG